MMHASLGRVTIEKKVWVLFIFLAAGDVAQPSAVRERFINVWRARQHFLLII